MSEGARTDDQNRNILLTYVDHGRQIALGSYAMGTILHRASGTAEAIVINLGEVVHRVYTPETLPSEPDPATARQWRDCFTQAAFTHLEVIDRLRPRAARGDITGKGHAWDDPDFSQLGICIGQIRQFGLALIRISNRVGIPSPSLERAVAEPLRLNSALAERAVSEVHRIVIRFEAMGSALQRRTASAVGLAWSKLSAEDFERLLYNLVANAPGYENPEWLTHTNAPDGGRDISVWRVTHDALAGTLRQRVIIACKHWQSASINVGEIATLREQVRLWEPPSIPVLVIATSGRFTSDAIRLIESNNHAASTLRIEPWASSHLEHLLAQRSELIEQFGLRPQSNS